MSYNFDDSWTRVVKTDDLSTAMIQIESEFRKRMDLEGDFMRSVLEHQINQFKSFYYDLLRRCEHREVSSWETMVEKLKREENND